MGRKSIKSGLITIAVTVLIFLGVLTGFLWKAAPAILLFIGGLLIGMIPGFYVGIYTVFAMAEKNPDMFKRIFSHS